MFKEKKSQAGAVAWQVKLQPGARIPYRQQLESWLLYCNQAPC